MAKKLKIWYDKEADFLEVLFSDAPGFMKETNNQAILERVDENGDILGFIVYGVNKMSVEKPIYAELSEAV